MNKNQFLTHFLFSLPDSTYKHHLPYSFTSTKIAHKFSYNGIPSAVLIPLIEEKGEVFVILTKRAAHLKKHAGQISFPGGKVESSDQTFIDTALRETYEEIGIKPSDVSVIGEIKKYETLTGYTITPIIGFLPEGSTFSIDKNEVDEVFKLPLGYFYRQHHYLEVPIIRNGKSHTVNFIPYQHYNIWGATAAILKDLAKLL